MKRKVSICFRIICISVVVVIIIIFSVPKFKTFVLSNCGMTLWKIQRHLEFDDNKMIARNYSKDDKNCNGISDAIDLVNGARKEVTNKTKYKSEYYKGGYPPKNEGVCTDVIWRAFFSIDVNLKDLIDEDIQNNTDLYARVENKPDPNIDFRRVPNQLTYFQRYAENLTTELDINDEENMKQWQPGDIVITLEPYEHVAMISDKKDPSGIPYIIHNAYNKASENIFDYNNVKIKGHFRWKY